MILILNNRKGSVGKNLWYILLAHKWGLHLPQWYWYMRELLTKSKDLFYAYAYRNFDLVCYKKRYCHIFIYFKSILREKNPQYTVCPYTWSWWRRYTCKCLMWKTLHVSLSWCFEACVLSVWFSLSLQTEGVWWHPIG